MAQKSTTETNAPAQERPNIVGDNSLANKYKKWEDLEYESDEDDCHPNIEIGTWRRLKERMRKEKGIKKKEPILVDKWNTTTTNKNYTIDPAKPPTKSDEQKESSIATESKTESVDSTKDNVADTESKNEAITVTTTNTEPSNESNGTKSDEPSTNKTEPDVSTKTASETTDAPPSSSSSPPKASTSTTASNDDDVYKARTNPQVFLDENLDKLRKFANIKNDKKADKFVKKNPELVHEASEGFLITFAVDRAVEGAGRPELARLARRTLMIHNLVQSCSAQNCAPELGVERFYSKIQSDPRMIASYKKELNVQVAELMERIEVRRVERLAELQDIPDEYDEEEKAPLGPGGLDPTEVLNSLPQEMCEAFVSQEVDKLREVLAAMDPDEAEYHMRRCVDAGLWVQPDEPDDGNNEETQDPKEQEAAKEETQNDSQCPPSEQVD